MNRHHSARAPRWPSGRQIALIFSLATAIVFTLQNLEHMTLIGNQLTELPESLVNCQKLQLLNLRMTGIHARPPQTLNMPNLTELLLLDLGRLTGRSGRQGLVANAP